jgi:biotin carboxylase
MLKMSSILKEAAHSLGFTWGWFMADFIIKDRKPYIIEITPRPGGDSIPDLIEVATGTDILNLYLDFISGETGEPNPIPFTSNSFASLNLYASREGYVTRLDTSQIGMIPWVKKLYLNKKIGDRIILPPLDYDSRKIGHCIISLESPNDLKEKQEILSKKMLLSICDHEGDAYSDKNKLGIFSG